MAEHKPMSYVDRLAYAQRVAKAAAFRTDPKLATRELCEAMNELIIGLLEREQGQPPSNPPSQ